MTLDTLYSTDFGVAIGELPAVGEPATVGQDELHDHPFLWALDSFLFAGPDAHTATQVYAQGGRVTDLQVDAYRILSTNDDGLMNLRREL